ncbi:indolepyruvate ferredoxin oxidoreductase family protein [Paracoccus versutus]|uniref:Indolepyruvate ferredoxin oxidoreductase n=1 Tax=Paracoccus versutus TaxID=34007 RepID=A0AAQ0KL91_PARVE|nr:indolepyruvate ferredoxin oxidoreductase family protein [Paracoccus versutus]REG45929.1 indolepyruvate ferredoxin oxidoreductase [Paracoccus versutus]WEJ77628.1 indolepyruvate ferredoxin oxidoreductase family protein [Paracoccus versutus]
MTIAQVSLSDRYDRREGRILISGVQALVRLMLVQADRDAAAGLRTGGFVSGYRGSPLGTLDAAFASARKFTETRDIVVRPAVNEELAATAIAGSQQIDMTPQARVQGVFGLWYGKGPGLDRAADAIRHGNYQGSSRFGGVVLAVGDDHVAKSSTVVCSSDETVASLHVPLFYPADAAEVVEYGLHGFALSRHSGSWVALKIVTDIADATRVVDTGREGFAPVLPPIAAPGGVHSRWPDTPLEQERRVHDIRLPAVLDYVRANRLDQSFGRRPSSRIGILAAGKSWLDLRDALDALGLDEAALIERGIALYKPAMIWPLEPQGLLEFASGLHTVVVVEEKAGFLERQAKDILYGRPDAPAILGKLDGTGAPLMAQTGDLSPETIAAALGRVLPGLPRDMAGTGRKLADLAEYALPPVVRKPFFCSGCPHNRSTVLPDGSRAYSGIGCHGMAALGRPRHSSFCQMGGEGVHWVGLAPFTDEPHVFANLGDGTYFHSGILAIRQAVASGVNLTYKLLYNSAVAMTGGQAVDGELSVGQLIAQVRAEGVTDVILVTDEPGRYGAADPLRGQVLRIAHRDEMDAVQKDMRTRPGVSVIVYEQMCATEKRRLRKRGKLAEPAERVFINDLVCEGCGDCSAKSNCLSVEPLETAFGTKRRINQSSCNKDFSCVTGFCPSFVTVAGGTPRKTRSAARLEDLPVLDKPPAAPPPPIQRTVVAGIGGTGVVTIGALVAMAAHIGGRQAGVMDQVGLAQKGGAVASHITIADRPIAALRIPARGADLILVCDQIVGNGRDIMAAVDPGRTHVLVNSDTPITGDFTQDRNALVDPTLLGRRIEHRVGTGRVAALPFTRLADRLLGDAIGSNLMMVGYAWQRGWIAFDRADFDSAIDLNGTAVAMTRMAFEWGRRLAADADAVMRITGLAGAEPQAETLDRIIARRAEFLATYQNCAYADRFLTKVAAVREAETRISADGALTQAAARSLFKLMAYKDEYEVARLYADGSFAKALTEQFEGDLKLSFHLAPPLLARRDKATGAPRKLRFGGWMMPVFRVLARFRGLRGTPLDPFGRTGERRTERALIREYEQVLDRLLAGLDADRLAEATAIAALPMEIRGFGHVKDRAVAAFRAELAQRMARYEAPPGEAGEDREPRVAQGADSGTQEGHPTIHAREENHGLHNHAGAAR